MELSFVGLIALIILYFVLRGVLKTWIRILEKLSVKAEKWVDELDTTHKE